MDEEFAGYAEQGSTMPAFDMSERLRQKRGPGAKLKKGEGEFPTTEGVPFYEVIEIPLEGLE